jgi:hypothetical protein
VPTPVIDLTFPHRWESEILSARPLIVPQHHFVYPREVEEVERGALEVLVRPASSGSQDGRSFLATCALGFRDPAVPTGLWSCPSAEELCAVAGGYAYVIDTAAPERFTMIPYRPVLQLVPALAQSLLLFVGHRSILAWGAQGKAWESEKLSDEGVSIQGVEDAILHGTGWQMLTDREAPFSLDLRTGLLIPPRP